MAQRFGKWEAVKRLDGGGQGNTFIVRDAPLAPTPTELRQTILQSIITMTTPIATNTSHHRSVNSDFDEASPG